MATVLNVRGFVWHKGLLDSEMQKRLIDQLRDVTACAPLFSPDTPYGKPMSVRMTSAGSLGWCSDRSGYRYEPQHPSGTAWPPIPEIALHIWKTVADADRDPDSCLINFYGQDAKMGLHQDKDEKDLSYPVVSVSLGNPARFRIGQNHRGGSTESVWLESGDVMVMGGAARLCYHGVDKIRFGATDLMPKGGRLNVTMRVAS